jgi:hypothetical protein
VSGFCAIFNKNNIPIVDYDLVDRLIKPAVLGEVGDARSLIERNIGLAVYDQFSADASRFLYSDPVVMVVCMSKSSVC